MGLRNIAVGERDSFNFISGALKADAERRLDLTDSGDHALHGRWRNGSQSVTAHPLRHPPALPRGKNLRQMRYGRFRARVEARSVC
jgi:hypothetical protein